MTKHWVWISGWGIAPERFAEVCQQAFPEFAHTVFAPTDRAIDKLLHAKADRIGGYSLGSLLLLEAAEHIPMETPLYLYGPILGFTQEMGLGGTTPASTLELLQTRLEKSPQKALKLFYRLAGLDEATSETLPYPLEDLAWGLEALAKKQAKPPHSRQIKVFLGEHDALLNSQSICKLFTRPIQLPHGHDYRQLLTDHASIYAR
jgi:hypothetical protein